VKYGNIGKDQEQDQMAELTLFKFANVEYFVLGNQGGDHVLICTLVKGEGRFVRPGLYAVACEDHEAHERLSQKISYEIAAGIVRSSCGVTRPYVVDEFLGLACVV
jgi:hypothetical protein